MKVYIKDMEMPRGCASCKISRRNGKKMICPFIWKCEWDIHDPMSADHRLDGCPLVHAADVQPVRHGRWIEDSDPGQEIGTAWRCSSCGLTIGMKKVEKDGHHYCFNCGAKMDSGGNKNVDS